jgi:hypothetical protein
MLGSLITLKLTFESHFHVALGGIPLSIPFPAPDCRRQSLPTDGQWLFACVKVNARAPESVKDGKWIHLPSLLIG